MNKHLQELVLDIHSASNLPLELCGALATDLVEEGYCKQIEAEWYDGICTNCTHEALDYLDETPCGCTMRTYITKFCPNCGAKMMKGDEGDEKKL